MKKESGVFHNKSFIDLVLYQFGYEECASSYSFGPAVREHFLFHYIISGKGKLVNINDRGVDTEYNLERGNGFMIWPGQRTFYIADEKNPWVYAWIEFDGLKAGELISEAGLSINSPVYTSVNYKERENMKNELLCIVKNKDRPPLCLMGHLYHCISAMIESSSKKKQSTGGSLKDFYVREALSFIEQHYQEQINIEEIAAFCKLDRSYLCKIFKSTLNINPKEYLIRYRIKKSIELMDRTEYSIKEISDIVGYQNQFYFSKAFKQIQGKSPSEWRKDNYILSKPLLR